MSFSPNSSRVRRTIDENYANKKRASSMKWIVVNAVFFLIFTYDLCSKCAGYTSLLHYIELCIAAALAANMLQHAWCLLPTRHSGEDVQSLNYSNTQLDASILNRSASSSDSVAFNSSMELSDADLSISSSRAWRRGGAGGSPAGAGGSPAGAPPSPREGSASAGVRDEFIADQDELTHYLKEYEQSHSPPEAGAGGWEGARAGGYAGVSPRAYHVAAMPAAEALCGGGGGSAAWRRVRLQPAELAHYTLNLRRWLHVTILERLARELAAVDAALARSGRADLKLGQVSVERLRAACGAAPGLRALLPFLQLCPDQPYLVRRIRELATGGCISNYKWSGGGAAWTRSQPCDAELLLRLLAAYVRSQQPAPPAPAAAAARCPALPASPLLCEGPPPPPPRRDISVHLVREYPPHYVLALEDDTIEVSSGHNNLIHTLLVAVAWGARREPPALWRAQLGPHALNLLWVIQR